MHTSPSPSTDSTLLGIPASPEHGPARPDLVDALRVALRADPGLPEHDIHLIARSASEDELVAALVELAPDALAMHAALGIAESVSQATLLDVGRKHTHYGVATVLPWMLGILRADVIEVGRLQVERQADDGVHGLHIPETGPLSPASVDESLNRIRALIGATVFSCTSWILDPVLQDALPDSNLSRFASRFTITDPDLPPRADGAASVAKFVFRMSPDAVRDPALEPRSSLERLIAARLREGHGWREPSGTLHLED